MRIKNRSDINRLSAAVTGFALVIVTGALMVLYPRAEWAWEFSVSWPLTTIICVLVTRIVGKQMMYINTLNERLQTLLDKDSLTDVATRDFFFAHLEERPDAYGVTLMIDIDFFKRVNDTYGHLTGDKVIAHVAQVLKGAVRSCDIVCRFGGEEFVVFLLDPDPGAARKTAERIRRIISGSIIDDEGIHVNVSVSVGGSPRTPASDIEDAIKQADAALYLAKARGRNCTVMAHEEPDLAPRDTAA